MFPRSLTGRLVLGMWLAAASGLLAFAYVQRDIHDMPVAFLWLMIFLTFPLGVIGSVAVGAVSATIFSSLGFGYQPFLEMAAYWCVLVVLGYVQWFILVPAVVRRLRHARRST